MGVAAWNSVRYGNRISPFCTVNLKSPLSWTSSGAGFGEVSPKQQELPGRIQRDDGGPPFPGRPAVVVLVLRSQGSLTARTLQRAESRMVCAVEPMMSLPTGVRWRSPITISSASSSSAVSTTSSAAVASEMLWRTE